MTIHVYPPDDWIEHKIDCDASECECPCEPEIDWSGCRPLVIHNAIDQREKVDGGPWVVFDRR